MAGSLCPHGFPAGSCLICQTLGLSPAAKTAEPAPPPVRPVGSNPQLSDRSSARPAVEVLTDRRPRRRSWTPRLLGLAMVALAAALAVWWVVTLVWALLRVVEVVAVAGLTGYCGWRLGVRHGRRHPRPPA